VSGIKASPNVAAGFRLENENVALPRGAWAKSTRLCVSWGEQALAAFSQSDFRSYLYPIRTPSGIVVTAEAPADHPHQQSVWVGADQVSCFFPYSANDFERGTYNFFVNEPFQGRAPGRIRALGWSRGYETDVSIQVALELAWEGPVEWGIDDGRRTIALETRTIALSAPSNGRYAIDIESRLSATDWDLELGPTRHAYLGIRLADGLRVIDGGRIVSPAATRNHAGVVIDTPGWIDYSGKASTGHEGGIALLAGTSAAGSSCVATDWGMLLLNPFATAGLRLARGGVFTLAARLIVHDGDTDAANIDEAFQQFLTEES
jgi:hypothetical protein